MRKNISRIYSGEIEGIGARLIELDINVDLHAFHKVAPTITDLEGSDLIKKHLVEAFGYRLGEGI